MKRRAFLLAALAGLATRPAWAGGVLDGVTGIEATQALRDSLAQGAKLALARLGQQDGYYANPKVRIGLHKNLKTAERVLRSLGQGKLVDDLILASNRAAEAAAPQAERLVVEAVRKMSVADAKAILSGGDGAATAYFRKATEAELSAALLPVIKGVTDQSGLARAYNRLAAKLNELAGIKSQQSTVENYVNRKALDGIYLGIAEEEHAIRAHPAQYTSNAIVKVFGLLQ